MTNVLESPLRQGAATIWTARTAVTLGLLSGLLGANMLCSDLATERHYQQLSGGGHNQKSVDEQIGITTSIDWSALRAQNADVAAWLQVDDTNIDYPVVLPSDSDSEFYLTHDFWKRESQVGCPFLDSRSDADSSHVIVYGHHLGGGKTMFSELYDSYREDSFAKIGALTWSTPQTGTIRLNPLCALSVDSSFNPIQRFSFGNAMDMSIWLDLICGQASAKTDDSALLIQEATRVITLVTCSSVIPGRQQRTIVLFVGQETGASQNGAVLAGLPPLTLPSES